MPRHAPASSGYSTAAVAGLCLICFIGGLYVHQLAVLPSMAPSDHGPLMQRKTLRKTLEVQAQDEQRNPVLSGNESDAAAAKLSAFRTFEDAAEAAGLLSKKQPIENGDSGHATYLVQPMQMLSLYPRAYLWPAFLDDERSDHFVDLAKSRLGPSGLALRKGDSMDTQRDVRTSQGTFISRHDDPAGVLAFVEEKLAQLTGIPSGHGEPFNVLRYELNQHYDAHYDVFDPESYGPQVSQRIITVLLYLSDVEEGGETVFPLEGKDGLARLGQPGFSYRDCTNGLRYKPRKGDALMFHSLHPNGTFDKHALHGGCPVKSGTKWVATKWIRDRCAFSGNC